MSEVEAGKIGTIHGVDVYNFTGSSKLTNIITYAYFGNLDYSAFGGHPFTTLTDPVKRVEFRYGADPGNFAQVDSTITSDGVMTIKVGRLPLLFAGQKAFSYAVIHEPNHHNALIDERRDSIIKNLGLFNVDSFAGPHKQHKLGIVRNIVEELVLRDSMRGMELANPTLKNAIGSYANWPSLDEILEGYGEKLYKYKGGLEVRLTIDEFNYLKAALQSMEPGEFAISDRCFPAHTRIQTSRSTSTAISALRVGDVVLAFDAWADKGRGALVPRRVTRLYRNTTTDWIRLRWSRGTARKAPPAPLHWQGSRPAQRSPAPAARQATCLVLASARHGLADIALRVEPASGQERGRAGHADMPTVCKSAKSQGTAGLPSGRVSRMQHVRRPQPGQLTMTSSSARCNSGNDQRGLRGNPLPSPGPRITWLPVISDDPNCNRRLLSIVPRRF